MVRFRIFLKVYYRVGLKGWVKGEKWTLKELKDIYTENYIYYRLNSVYWDILRKGLYINDIQYNNFIEYFESNF